MAKQIVFPAVLALALLAAARPAMAQATLDTETDAAIQRGVEQIWSTQQPSGLFSDLDPANPPASTPSRPVYPGDRTVMAMAVLAYAGETPKKNPKMAKALKAMLELDLAKTYTLSIRVIALAELIRHVEGRLKGGLRQAIKKDVAQLIDIQHSHGGWHYNKVNAEKYWDFSNTQFAILALRDARLSGVEVPLEPFKRSLGLYLSKQHADGGWSYGRLGFDTPHSTGSMTAPAVASLFIIRDALDPGQGCPCRSGRSRSRRDPVLQASIYRGVDWLGKEFSPSSNPNSQGQTYYWLYAAERVGMTTGFKYLGTHDWYREGAEFLLRRQQGGAWGGFSSTAFALLFLIKGRGPILLNKLQYDGPWDLHPYDAANLAAFAGDIKEQRINWQVIHLGIPVEAMHDSPILYITAEQPIEFSDEHKKKLREFTDTGGTLVIEASCGNRAVDAWWQKLFRELWPEWELKAVGKEHPLWTADLKIFRRPPVLKGIGDGLRTFLFYSPRDISCQWHAMSVTRNEPMFQLGVNLYAYATDRGKLRARLAGRQVGTGTKYAGQAPAWRGATKGLAVAPLKHGGQWYLNRRYRPWQVLGDDLKQRTGIVIDEPEPLEPGKPISSQVDVVYLAGRGQVTLGDEAVEALKKYLEATGFLLAEATAGDAEFDKSFRQLASAMGLTFKPVEADHPLLSGQLGRSAQGYSIAQVGYTFALLKQRVGRPQPELFAVHLGKRLVGVYSPYDILFAQTGCKAFDLRGYEADDARALATNIVLLAKRQLEGE